MFDCLDWKFFRGKKGLIALEFTVWTMLYAVFFVFMVVGVIVWLTEGFDSLVKLMKDILRFGR